MGFFFFFFLLPFDFKKVVKTFFFFFRKESQVETRTGRRMNFKITKARKENGLWVL